MTELSPYDSQPSENLSLTLRDVFAVGFRRRRVILVAFFASFASIALYAAFQERDYEAELKILVKRERVDPIVSPEQGAVPDRFPAVTEQDLNSEMEILRSRDLLEQVVVSVGLDEPQEETPLGGFRKRVAEFFGEPSSAEKRRAEAVVGLDGTIVVEPLRKSNLIRVAYPSTDPELAAQVLNTLADLYLDKHLAVHRPAGTYGFFSQETERYLDQLNEATARLNSFTQETGVVAPEMEKNIAVSRIGDFEAGLEDTKSQIAVTRERIRSLEATLESTPSRITTTMTTASGGHLEQLQLTLVNLRLKRDELLRIYQPDYPLVQEADRQIAIADAAIREAESSPLMEETSDQNAAFEWTESELAKARAELAGLEARAESLARTIQTYREKARRLDGLEQVHGNLARTADLAEQNYVVNFRKQEEARISDELDQQRIVNVAVVEAATVPHLPAGLPPLAIVLFGGVLATVVSGGLALATEYLDPSFKSPHELEAFLDIPVAAAIPEVPRRLDSTKARTWLPPGRSS